MNAGKPAEGCVSRLLIFLLTIAWSGGTIAFFLAAVAESFCSLCQISDHRQLLADRFVLGSLICAGVFPSLAALIFYFTRRRILTVLFTVLSASVTLAYGVTLGAGAVRDIHRIELKTSVPAPPNNCPCYSGGSCDCPGG